MKKITLLATLTFCFVTVLNSTTFAQKAAPVSIQPKAVELYWLDLSPAGINAVIQVPVTVKIIEDKYDVIIGDGKDFFIEIAPTSQTFAEIKSFVEKNDIRGFVKFIKQETNGFVAEMKAFGKTEYDFSFVATVGDENYLIKDPGKYHHPNIAIVSAMYNYAKTIKAK